MSEVFISIVLPNFISGLIVYFGYELKSKSLRKNNY